MIRRNPILSAWEHRILIYLVEDKIRKSKRELHGVFRFQAELELPKLNRLLNKLCETEGEDYKSDHL